jgi:LPS export ABC transporter permease LptF
MRLSWKISRYLIGAILPYFIFSWLLLSVILFVQQASRFSDIFFSVNIPTNLVWQLTFALVPNVIAFTCPMAVLVGVIIGLSKMQGDSELTAIRAAGVGNFQITLPVLVLGVVLSLFAFFINLYGVPFAARVVRTVAMQTAIYKLESPIEPGVFNTEVAGFTIYVKDGDLTDGKWKNIFIYNEDEKTGTTRLITSSNGRIDSTDQLSELVLENAVASTFTKNGNQQKYVSENIGEARFAIKTKRGELIQKLSSSEISPEELGLAQLSDYAGQKEGRERTEAQILWQRRIILSLTPLIFCLLGTAMMLRFSGRGRGFGIFVALISLIAYYLLAFLGEQLARTGKISVFAGSLIPIVMSFFAILWFNFLGRTDIFSGLADRISLAVSKLFTRQGGGGQTSLFRDLTTGLRDFDLIVNLIKYYALTLGFLATVFIIFTAFELWKFAGTIDGGVSLLGKYIFYLLPFIYLQLAPSAAMVATLATYVIKSRQNEIVTWTSAGQSVYRLLFPCLLFMLVLGVVNWQVQEWIAPRANQIQDGLRNQIRSRGVLANKGGKFWVANDKRIYSFELDNTASDNDTKSSPPYKGGVDAASADGVVLSNSSIEKQVASDNDKRVANLTIYEFSDNGTRLQNLYRIPRATWEKDRIVFTGEAEKSVLEGGKIETIKLTGGELAEDSNPFAEMRKKPSHLNTSETKAQLNNSESDIEKRSFGVALEKKYTAIFLPFIIALFTAPFALSLSRKGKVLTVGYAVGLWLLFMGVTSTFEQFGLNGYLTPAFAVWGPLVLFSMLGIYLLSKVKT